MHNMNCKGEMKHAIFSITYKQDIDSFSGS